MAGFAKSEQSVTAEKRPRYRGRVLVMINGRMTPIDLPPIFRATFKTPRSPAQLRCLGDVS